ncbi:MAG: TadE/TadG family type IV pilus assembly protein [Actinomycetota bacterium]
MAGSGPSVPAPGDHPSPRPRPRFLRDEDGAEIIEFALVAPLVLFLVFGLIYGLLTIAAQLSLAHAASVGVRYASIPTDPAVDAYPTPGAVATRVVDSTPFFGAGACATTVTGDSTPNAPVDLDVSCDFPNPLGRALNGLRGIFIPDGASPYASDLSLSMSARGRRE